MKLVCRTALIAVFGFLFARCAHPQQAATAAAGTPPAPAQAAGQPAPAAPQRPLQVEDLFLVRRVSDPQVSPDGKWVAYTVRTVSLENNAGVSHVWLVPAAGGTPRQLTNHDKGESRPRWSPDGKWIAFLSARSGSQQIWKIATDGGEAVQVTSLSTGADGQVWSPTGLELAFSSEVRPGLEGGDAAQARKEQELVASGVQALILDHLLHRHWNSWRHGKRNHLFVVPAAGGEARDLTPGEIDVPPFVLAGGDPYAFSPDGKEIAYTRGPDAASEAWSTNSDIFVISTAGGSPVCLTAENKGADATPAWSPDGKLLAYRSQARDGYEADRVRLAVLERAAPRPVYLAADVDRSVDELLWRPEGKAIYFLAEDEGRASVYAVTLEGLAQQGASGKVISNASIGELSLSRDAAHLYCTTQSFTRPAEVARLDLAQAIQGKPALEILTHENDQLFAQILPSQVESIRYAGALGAQVQAWLIRPPGLAEGTKAPLVVFIHGGPQGAWTDVFHFRWNAALFAARGYMAILPNPHGSTGFGQAFTEQISGDWGGAVYEDVMKCVDWAIEKGVADPERIAAIGGSFGGYMVNWILGHTQRFKALVSHAGVYNLESMYGHTEEIWFPEWEFKGAPWQNRELYEKFSPHRFAQNFKTPTLVVHGELDFRVPVSEGLQLFTALQRQGVPSRFLYFPDEGHWVLKPRSSKLWNETVLGWLDQHLKTPAPPAPPAT